VSLEEELLLAGLGVAGQGPVGEALPSGLVDHPDHPAGDGQGHRPPDRGVRPRRGAQSGGLLLIESSHHHGNIITHPPAPTDVAGASTPVANPLDRERG
jgi:hypothetical protein